MASKESCSAPWVGVDDVNLVDRTDPHEERPSVGLVNRSTRTTTRIGSSTLSLTAALLLVVQACSSPVPPPATLPDTSQSTATPTHVRPLEGGGRPDAGDVGLGFSGTYDVSGKAAAFDGGSGFAATSGPGPVDTTASFSVDPWVNLSPPRRLGGAELPAAVSQLGDVAAAFYLGVGEGKWNFAMKDMDTNEPGHTIRASATAASPNRDTWRHLVGIYDDQAEQIRLYLDGKPAAQKSFNAPWQADGPLTVGSSQAHSQMEGFWPGSVADVRIFPAALNDADVSALAKQGKPNSPPPAMPMPPSITGIPNGTYEYTFDAKEKAALESLWSTEEAAAAGGFDRTVGTAVRLRDGQWQQYYTFDGKIYEIAGQPEGDGGTHTVKGDKLVTSNGGGTATYRWSLDRTKERLFLTLLANSAGAEDAKVVRLVTEHNHRLAPQ